MKIETYSNQDTKHITRGMKFKKDSKVVFAISYSRLLRKGSTWMDDFKNDRKLAYLKKDNFKLSAKALVIGRTKFNLVIPFYRNKKSPTVVKQMFSDNL